MALVVDMIDYFLMYEDHNELGSDYVDFVDLVDLLQGKSPQNGTERVSVTSAKTFFFP